MNDIKNGTIDTAASIREGRLVNARNDSVWCESAGDFTLPDYMPEIGKMLACTPRIIPSGKYIGSDRAEFSGSILYSVLYTGDDGLPFYTTLSGDYEYTVALGDASDSSRIEIYDEPAVESVSVRASGPRRISIKTRIRSRPCIAYEPKNEQESIPARSDNDYQRLTETRRVSSHRHFDSGEFSLSESFKLDTSPEAEPVGCDGVVYVTDTQKTADAVLCRGEVDFRILYYDIEGGRRKLKCTQKKMRFEHEIPIKAADTITGIRAYGRVISMDMAVSGDSHEIAVTAAVDIFGEYTEEREEELLCDIYSCSHSLGVKHENTEYIRGVLCRNLNVSCHAERPLSGEGREYEVCTASATARVNSVSVTGVGAEFSGEISVDCLLFGNDEDGEECSSVTLSIPFKCESPVSAEAQKYDISVMAETAGIRMRAEKDKLSADAELYLSVLIEGIDSVSTVKGVSEISPASERGRSVISVYYPDKGETLWSVAKKYSVPLTVTAQNNGIGAEFPDSESSLDGVRCMLIV